MTILLALIKCVAGVIGAFCALFAAVAIIIHIISPRTNPAMPASEFLVRRRPRRTTHRRRRSSRPEELMESRKASEDSEETTARRKSIFNRSKSFAGALLRPEAGPSSSNSSKWRRPSISKAISALKGASLPAVVVEDASADSPTIPNPGRHRRPSLMRALTNFRAHSAFEPANPPGLETRGPIEGSAFGDYSIIVQKPPSIVDPADRLSEAGLVDMPVIPGSTPPIGHRRTRAIPTIKRRDYGALQTGDRTSRMPSQGLAKSEMVRSNSSRRVPKPAPMSRATSSRGSRR